MTEDPTKQAEDPNAPLSQLVEALENGDVKGVDPSLLARLHAATAPSETITSDPETGAEQDPAKGIRGWVSRRFGHALSREKRPQEKALTFDPSEVPEGLEGLEWLLEHREQVFPWVTDFINFDNSGYNHRNRFAKAAMEEAVTWEEDDKRARAIPKEALEATAQLVGAYGTHEIGLIKDTTDGLICVAQNFEWEAGDKIVVLSSDFEFQSNYNPWKALEKTRGVEIIEIGKENGLVEPEEVERVLKEHQPRMVALSSNGWKTGQRVDLRRIGALVEGHNQGKEVSEKTTRFCVDGIQSVGAAPINVKDCFIDFMAVGSSKWLTAGSTSGFLYISEEAMGDFNREMYLRQNYDEVSSPVQEKASVIHGGKSPYIPASALAASATLLNRIGVETIHKRIVELTDYLSKRLDEIGCKVTSPRASKEEKSGIVFFRPKDWPSVDEPAPEGKKTEEEQLQESLKKRKGLPIRIAIRGKESIEVDGDPHFRKGNVRVSVHYYNTKEEIDQLIAEIEKVLKKKPLK